MNRIAIWILMAMGTLNGHSQGHQQHLVVSPMVSIKGGEFLPFYSQNNAKATVRTFWMDQYPVTNEHFAAFVRHHPEWSATGVKQIFADTGYLKQLSGTERGVTEMAKRPVVNVSWFAARAYCECQGKRLATHDEWEFVARASLSKPDGSADSTFYQRILDWYSKPTQTLLPEIGSTYKNYYGVYDMLGLVWEWVEDFNAAMLIGESRANSGLDRELFCASGSIGATDKRNYASFMRYALRSSLKASYTLSNLGFRCASNNPVHNGTKH